MSFVVLLNFSGVGYNTNYGLLKKYYAETRESGIGHGEIILLLIFLHFSKM